MPCATSIFAPNPPSSDFKRLESRICEHAFVGVAGSNSALFERALRNGDLGSAWAYATSLSHVSLEDALQLTLLAIKKDAHRFDAMAKRCIVRLIEERSVTFHEVEWAIQRLRDETEGLDGRTGLLNLLEQKPARARS